MGDSAPPAAARSRPGPGALDGIGVLVGEDDDVEIGPQVGLLLLGPLDVGVVKGLEGDAHVVEDVARPALVHVAAPGLEEPDARELDGCLGEGGDVVDVEDGQVEFFGERRERLLHRRRVLDDEATGLEVVALDRRLSLSSARPRPRP